MSYIADLHIHSRFSMATSKALTTDEIAVWAARKGIGVVGTGDFTHPVWLDELARDLIFDEESGLYVHGSSGVHFCLQAEISCIYRRDGKVRKVHNLVYAPDLGTAKKISSRLARVGNITSDGRPILKLDSRDLLEIVLESSPRAVLIPAHIWTPWYSLFGSRSGFDRLEDCYGDLAEHIFALETGLSSDPAMNRCISALDKYALVSNSDAHSMSNLGREANLFAGQPAYDALFGSLRASARGEDDSGFLGTLEFFPQEGKYHLDGHRACGVVLEPEESRELGNICPVCGKPLTIGVMHRVMELADRPLPRDSAVPFGPEATLLTPLVEVIAQIVGAGPSSRKVHKVLDDVTARLGPELNVLTTLPLEEIRSFWEPLGAAIANLRSGRVEIIPGFDGRYGKVQVV